MNRIAAWVASIVYMPYAKHYQNKPEYVDRRRKLRFEKTKAEYVLWQELRREKLGYRFRRQFQIGNFITDFYCHELKLIIEVDGPVHEGKEIYDAKRQCWLEEQGFVVIRFKNDEVLFDRERVMSLIKESCTSLATTINNATNKVPPPIRAGG